MDKKELNNRINNLIEKKKSNVDFYMILVCLKESYGLSEQSFNDVMKSLRIFNKSIDKEIIIIEEIKKGY